jgi:uncharacterized membrane protein YfcA
VGRSTARCGSAARAPASAVAVFALSSDVHWVQGAVTAIGASFGGWAGALMLKSVNEKLLKLAVVAIGAALTVGLFWKAP